MSKYLHSLLSIFTLVFGKKPALKLSNILHYFFSLCSGILLPIKCTDWYKKIENVAFLCVNFLLLKRTSWHNGSKTKGRQWWGEADEDMERINRVLTNLLLEYGYHTKWKLSWLILRSCYFFIEIFFIGFDSIWNIHHFVNQLLYILLFFT